MSERPAPRNGARFHCPGPLASGARIVLPERVAHHVRVLRLAAGDSLVLFSGEGGEHEATLLRVDKREAVAEIGAWSGRDVESPLSLVLAQGISAAEKMDYTIQKCVELGVTRIEPLQTTKAVVRLDGERALRRLAHWRQIAVSACEQCGRNTIPEVAPVAQLRDWLATVAEPLRLLLSPRAETRVGDLPRSDGPILLLSGPEGGLAPEEERAALVAGFTPLRLGPRILRTETAALAALAALQSHFGDL
jgi:16S rRNA (uracil1498-N3)-methyltransferase